MISPASKTDDEFAILGIGDRERPVEIGDEVQFVSLEAKEPRLRVVARRCQNSISEQEQEFLVCTRARGEFLRHSLSANRYSSWFHYESFHLLTSLFRESQSLDRGPFPWTFRNLSEAQPNLARSQRFMWRGKNCEILSNCRAVTRALPMSNDSGAMNARAIVTNETEQEWRSFAAGIWRLADPKISLASAASMFLGASAAAAVVPLNWGWLAVTVLGIFAIEVAKNASGEIFDFESGADLAVAPQDRTPFSGGKRVLVEGLLTREQTWLIAAACYALGAGIGLSIVLWRAPAVAAIGIVGVVLAYQYHAPPLKLSYRGLGELAVALCYGPLIAIGTYLVQVPDVSIALILAAIPLGLLIAGFLWVNEFPDYAADKSVGKKTLIVRLGRARAAWVYLALNVTALVLIGLLPFFGVTPWALLGLIASIPAIAGAVRLIKHSAVTTRNIAVQRSALITFLLASLGLGTGFLLGP